MADVLILLSGGLDSLIASITARILKEEDKKYILYRFRCECPDVIAARKAADFIGTEHHEVFLL
jgi:asparagine synthase (glutamine-hydrolysing)